MALVWAEPFDQYGGGVIATLLPQFGYTDVGGSGWATPGRTGGYAMWMFNAGQIRRALDTPVTTCGQGIAFNYQGGVGGNDYRNGGLHFESAGKIHEMSAVVLPDLSVGIFDRTGTLAGKTAPNKLIGNSYVYIEAKLIGNTAGANTGTAKVRINGDPATETTVNGMNFPNAIAYVFIGTNGGGTSAYYDDWIVWDNTGAQNNDFMGDRRLFVSYPNANLATQDFTPTPAGNAFDRVNDAPPVDTAYIEAAAAGNVSEFSKDAIAIASTDIAAVVPIARLFKSDAGLATGRVGINSNGFVANSAEQFPGTTSAWFRNIVELNPNGNIPWTKAAVDAAALRVTRVQ